MAAAANISVNKQSVKQFLESGKEHLFVIPEYQRPYRWSNDQIETLFDDLVDFITDGGGGSKGNGTYFLGSIVSYENDKGEQEIIDGQQRITSLFLLLRAIYTKLVSTENKTEEATFFIAQIEPAIWHTNHLTGKVDYNSMFLQSRVLNHEGNEILHSILRSGWSDPNAEDCYSQNYRIFQRKIEELSRDDPLRVYNFIYAVLNQAVLLPISASDRDTALTIFSTLNDRGMPLSDSDIFKAELYKRQDAGEKGAFVEKWKNLIEQAEDAGEDYQKLFTYYMFYLRALEGDSKSTTPGLRKYFFADKNQRDNRLYRPELMDDLDRLARFWRVVKRNEEIPDEPWSQDIPILKALDILTDYPNEYWKYPTLTYYLAHSREANFTENFRRYLYKLLQELLSQYLLKPFLNAVKADIMKLNVECVFKSVPSFDFKEVDQEQLEKIIVTPPRWSVRMLLKILAYQKQDKLLPDRWEIEHIFPRKWRDNYITSVADDEVRRKIEHIGNKLPLEKKQNIVAGNNYFLQKQKEYAKSKIQIALDMSTLGRDWTLNDIEVRDEHIVDEILRLFKKWDEDYRAQA